MMMMQSKMTMTKLVAMKNKKRKWHDINFSGDDEFNFKKEHDDIKAFDDDGCQRQECNQDYIYQSDDNEN